MDETRSFIFPTLDLERNRILNVSFDSVSTVSYDRFIEGLVDASTRVTRTRASELPIWTWRHQVKAEWVVKKDHPPIEF
jgi:hypothetical protein